MLSAAGQYCACQNAAARRQIQPAKFKEHWRDLAQRVLIGCSGHLRRNSPEMCWQALSTFGVSMIILATSAAVVKPMSRLEVRQQAAALAELGEKLFADPRLSPSGRLACASCHSPDRAFGPPNAFSVELGGRDMRQPGLRAVPSIRYLQAVPQFTEHFFDSEDEADESIDNGPTGGLTWDGRVDSGMRRRAFPYSLLLKWRMTVPRRSSPTHSRRATVRQLPRFLGATLWPTITAHLTRSR